MRQARGTHTGCYRALVLATGLLVTPVSVATQPVPLGSHTVTVVTGEWPPYVTRSGAQHGPLGQVTERVFNNAGYRVSFIFQPWKRSKDQVREGEADVLMPAYCSADRIASYRCSDAIITGKQVLFHRRDMPFSWSAIKDLQNYVIGGTLGYYYGEAFEAAEQRGDLKVLRIASDATNMRLLMKGRIQLYPQDKAVGFAMLHNLFPPERWSEVTCDDTPLHEQSLHLLFTRKTPRGAKLQRVFNQGLSHLRHTGELSRIMSDLTGSDQILPVWSEHDRAGQRR